MTHPDRETSEARLEQVKAEQRQLEEKQIKLEDKLEIRKKQFHVLVSTVHQLQVSDFFFLSHTLVMVWEIPAILAPSGNPSEYLHLPELGWQE